MAKKQKPTQAGIYFRPDIAREIDTRGDNRSAIVTRDLERLYSLYRRSMKEVTLTVAEGSLLVDALNGSLMDAASAALLWAEIEDAIKLDNLAEKWNVDGQALVEKLKGLTAIQSLAIVDAAERFWASDVQDIADGVKATFNIE